MIGIKLKEIKPGMVIHCKTQEEADILGYDEWYKYKEETCYRLYDSGYYSFGYYDHYKRQGCEITEFEDLIIKEEESETMDISVEKIEESLRVIREVCKSHEECKTCPLRTYSGSDCQLETRPDCWELKSDKKSDNRLFE